MKYIKFVLIVIIIAITISNALEKRHQVPLSDTEIKELITETYVPKIKSFNSQCCDLISVEIVKWAEPEEFDDKKRYYAEMVIESDCGNAQSWETGMYYFEVSDTSSDAEEWYFAKQSDEGLDKSNS